MIVVYSAVDMWINFSLR